MDKFLFAQFQKTDKFNTVVENINSQKRQLIYGLNEEGLAYLCCNLNESTLNKILIITSDDFKAKQINKYISAYTKNAELFNSRELIMYNVDALSKEDVHKRVNVINKIINNKKLIVTASVNSLVSKIIPKGKFKKNILKLEYGKNYDFDSIIQNLIKLGYERVDAIEGQGQFSVRGGIIDIFSLSNENPYRVEFFDDEIDSIRLVDVKTQRSIKNEKKLVVLPCSDVFFDEKDVEVIKKELKKDYDKRYKKLESISESKKIRDTLTELYGSYDSNLNLKFQFGNKDLILPFSQNKFESIIDYFDEKDVIILIEPDKVYLELGVAMESFNLKYTELFEKGEAFFKQSSINFSKTDILEKLKGKNLMYHNALIKQNRNFEIDDICQIISKSATSYYGKMEDLSNDLNRYKYKGYKTVIVLSNNEGCKKLHSILNDHNCSTMLSVENDAQMSGQILISTGDIKKGFELPEVKILLLTENEIFGTTKKKHKLKKKSKKSKIETFSDLKVGDYVVHEYHGIGQYVGIEKLNVQNIKKDYLCVKYRGQDKLYVPVDQLSIIQKYIGSDSITPKINKMSSQDWVKVKERTKKAIEDMAQELLELYAKRKLLKGYSFSPDTEWQKDFEYKFPFEETDDQLKCIKEIKKDMQKQQPMDRLLCGDVGFGKTEVALRAVFKAVMDGKQVAILVPTTILAQQHYSSVIDRFRGFPIKAEMLSRFRTSSQQKKIIEALNKGLIDIVVGTHKILSKDIKFKDLGLLVIDEEQRFGVRHKEAIKQLKANIDVLTLSATPIPRTLHMSMIGVRDMSLIEEPPGDRLPIQTYVIEYSDGLIKDAIEKELSRDGQVYYVHNRVTDIESVARKIRELVPTARVVVGHGQMHERELENVMFNFVDKEYDVLVCTTIIETGMDIPNANTLIIDNANNFGLSQLYQLRGRVGRSNKTSFAYLTYEKNKVLTEIAEKRLKAIREFTEFGSGFKIAMRDLEIRGCGNILGSEQHGHMIAIGYDLYVKFLERAVKKLSGENINEDETEISVDLSVDGYIPSSFISIEEQKIDIYKKIAAISNQEDVLDITEEIIDRFGTIPKEVNNLIKVAYIKTLCIKLGVISITQSGKILKIEFRSNASLDIKCMNYLISKHSDKIKFDVSKEPVIKYQLKSIEQEEILNEIKVVFESMLDAKINKEES
ncbi:transcription-repair coupling factor [Sedimentibacter sp. zth1]|uniref:transcription-repair coupling factor n=1 Tax=Sedimentibacter sp. zth1 TaxID=2816908 RepID=UPI001A92464C|nr:transcription-repair coupling factor [Sedimentibacter sp. zth1]QSX04939.1 transcription-repair coupling factor [Sedimentibacter sp. zth1]